MDLICGVLHRQVIGLESCDVQTWFVMKIIEVQVAFYITDHDVKYSYTDYKCIFREMRVSKT